MAALERAEGQSQPKEMYRFRRKGWRAEAWSCSLKLSEKCWRFSYIENILCIDFTFCWCTCLPSAFLFYRIALRFAWFFPALLWNYIFCSIRFTSLWLEEKKIFPLLWPTSNWGNETFQWFASGFSFCATLLRAAIYKQKKKTQTKRVLFITFKALWPNFLTVTQKVQP